MARKLKRQWSEESLLHQQRLPPCPPDGDAELARRLAEADEADAKSSGRGDAGGAAGRARPRNRGGWGRGGGSISTRDVPTCVVCRGELPREGSTYRFFRHNFFEEERYCPSHQDRSKRCHSCYRLEREGKGAELLSPLADGRVTCLACVRSAVLDSAEAAPVYKDILHFFDETLGLSVPADMWDIPVLLVEMPTLNERQTDRHIGERQEGGPASSMTRGLCLSEVGKVSHFDSGGVRFDRRTGKFSFSAPKVRFLHETRAVTAILVLHGLPRDLCGSILAHEAMHAWIKLNPQAPADLPDQVEEGLCQLIAHLWLQKRQADASNPSIPGAAGGAAGAAAGRGGSHFDQPRTQSETTSSALSVTPSDEELRSFFLYQIETDQSLVYGDGFRAAMRAHSVLGLRELLDFVAKHHVFPIV